LSNIGMVFRSFFALLGGKLPEDVAAHFGYTKASRKQADAPKPPEAKTSDGALQLLGILQRDARLLDFLMEDIGPYSDDQVGSAVRNVHAQCQDSLGKYIKFAPVIDGVEGTFTKPESAGALARDPNAIKFVGNIPAQGKPTGGILRHKGWRVDNVSLPAIHQKHPVSILAPAELEVE
jgi:hypothetical protein